MAELTENAGVPAEARSLGVEKEALMKDVSLSADTIMSKYAAAEAARNAKSAALEAGEEAAVAADVARIARG